MNRVLASLALVASAALGLAACSSDNGAEAAPEAETVQSAVVEEEAAEETESTGDISLVDECLSLAEPLGKANAAMLAIADDTANDPQNAVDMWRALAVAFEDSGASATNPKVAELSAAVGTNGHALADEMQRVFVDQDVSQMGAYTEASDAFFTSYGEILELCDTAQ